MWFRKTPITIDHLCRALNENSFITFVLLQVAYNSFSIHLLSIYTGVS